ncbi:MAG: GNAT family N-acetyltransferase [Anaerolineaceae bacterium]
MEIEFVHADPDVHGAAFLALFDHALEDTGHPARVMAVPLHDLWVALDHGVVVGGVLCREIQAHGKNLGGVENLVVAGTHTGRGIGRRLVAMAEQHYRQRGLQGMQLTVRADNAPARTLYDSLGYQIVERRIRLWKEFTVETNEPDLGGNKQVIVRWTEDVWNSGKLERVGDLVSDRCIRHDPGKPARRINVAENVERIASFRKQVPDLHFTNDDLVAEGDRVVARFSMTGTDPEKREKFAFSGIEIFRVQAGRIVETWSSETAPGPWQDSPRR